MKTSNDAGQRPACTIKVDPDVSSDRHGERRHSVHAAGVDRLSLNDERDDLFERHAAEAPVGFGCVPEVFRQRPTVGAG